MIIGDMSIDPRRVVCADLEYSRTVWVLTVQYLIGDAVTSLDDYYDDYDEAIADLAKIDGASYKGPLADAVADKTIDDGDGDDLGYGKKIGFKE